MLFERKLVRASDEDRQVDPRNEIGEVSVLETLNGQSQGLFRSINRLVNVTIKDENKNDLEVVVAYSDGKVIQYEVDAGGSLKFDDEEGIAYFSTRGIQYRIRAIQRSDGPLWDSYQRFSQNKKRG